MPPDVLTGVITREGIAEKPDGWGVDQAEFNSFAEDAPIPTGLGKGEKTVLLFGLLSLVVAACIPKQAPPGVDLSPSGEDDNSDLSPLLCAQLVNMANLHSVDVAVADQAWQSALTNTKPLQAQLDCFMPEKGPAVPTLTVAGIAPGGPEPGDEIVQLALASPDGVQPLLAVPLGSVDENSDGAADYRLVKFLSPKPGGWQSLGVDQAQTVLPEAYIDSQTGQIGLEAGAATVTATRRPDGSMSFSLQSGGGQPLVLSEEQLRPLTAAASLLDQAEAFLKGQQILTLDQVPGVDLGMKGPKYGLPEAVFAELQGRGGAPIVLQGGLAGAKSGSECELALPDHLVTGETINQATDGRAQYLDFNGAVATEGLWRLPAADDVYCVAFVAKDNNQWGLASGTVALWLYRDGGKAGTEILNPDSPVQLLWESPNQGQLVMTDDGFKLVVTSPDGVVLRDQEVKFGPSDAELLAKAPNQRFWGERYKIERALRQDIWPVLTGENLEMIKEINGQPVVIKGRLGVIPNPYQPGEILKIFIPYRYEWGNGLFSEEWIFENNVNKGVDYFLQLPAGKQLRIAATIDSSNKPVECTFGTRCGWSYDISDLSADFFLNGVTPDEPVIISPVSIQVK